MTTIPASFTKYGYVFSLIKRSAKAAIYGQYRGNKLHAYEVHRIRVLKPRVLRGVEYPATERLASDADWGVWAKTYSASLYGTHEANSLAEAMLLRWSGKQAA